MPDAPAADWITVEPGRLWAPPGGVALLRAAGWTAFDALFAAGGGDVLRRWGTRWTVRLVVGGGPDSAAGRPTLATPKGGEGGVRSTPGQGGDPGATRSAASSSSGTAVYLKRHGRIAERDGWWAELWRRLARRPAITDARRELQNLLALRAAGFATAEPSALAEDPATGRSALLLAELSGAEPADDRLSRECPLPSCGGPADGTAEERRTLLRRVAELARRMHDAGFTHQDFYLCHVFVERGVPAAGAGLWLIDLQRVVRFGPGRVPWGRRVKDVAQLLYSMQPGFAGRTDRMRVLAGYTDGMARAGRKRLAAAVQAKVARIARHDAKLTARGAHDGHRSR